MKIKIFPFETEISFCKDYINILEIANKGLFIKLVESFNNLLNKEEGIENILLVKEEKILDLSKNSMIIFDILNINFNAESY